MNKHERYVEVCKQMDLLGIKDVSTPRQAKNGTVVWQLPIKNNWPGNQANASFIKVASFSTGYVRNQNSGYSNYQLNKRCESKPQYYPDHEWKTLGNGDYTQVKTGKYRKFVTRGCVLIPNEIDRLEYLIAYCLKNYYIKLANQVIDGKYVSKWEHEYMVNKTIKLYEGYDHADLEEKLEMTQNEYKNRSNEVNDLEVEVELLQANIRNLENKLATIERIANDRNKWNG